MAQQSYHNKRPLTTERHQDHTARLARLARLNRIEDSMRLAYENTGDVNAGVYSECMGHIQRGLPGRMGQLQAERDVAALFDSARLKSGSKPILKIPATRDA